MSRKFLTIFFLVKVVAAISYGLLQYYVYGYGDTFNYVKSSNVVYELLPEHPDDYVTLTFGKAEKPIPPEIKKHIGRNKLQYYGHPRNYMMVRINSFINLFTGGYYFANSIFFAFVSFVGIYNIILFFSRFFPEKVNWFKWLLCFFPSILFWGSGIHKDAIIFFGIGLLLASIFQLFKRRWAHIFLFLFSGWLIYMTRNYVFLILLPAIICLFFICTFPRHKLLKMSVVYLFGIIVFFSAGLITPKLNFPQEFVETQQHFRDLGANSNFDMDVLEPTPVSFLESLPVALKHTFLKPYFTEIDDPLRFFAFADNYLFLLILIGVLFLGKFKGFTDHQSSVLFFAVFFGVSFLVLIGVIVTNLGAMVRYETTANLFLLSAAIIIYDEKKVLNFFKRIGISR